MYVCINIGSKRWKGTENTPLGKGYSASGEEKGKRMMGRDGNMYYVQLLANGNKRWRLVTRSGSPRLMFSRFTALNLNSDFSYSYARYTIFCDVEDDGRVTILRIKMSPFGDLVSMHDIPETIRDDMIKDLEQRIKEKPSLRKKAALRDLKITLRKSRDPSDYS